MKYLNIRFPDDVAADSTGGPEFSTSIVTMQNKNECRNANWQQPRFRYKLASAIKNIKDYEKVKNFFTICKGREFSFRFKDFADYTIKNQYILTGNGTIPAPIQLAKTYTFGEYLFNRKITKITPSTFHLYFNSKEQDQSNYKVDESTGVINITQVVPLGMNVYVTCEFDVQVRFDIDYLPVLYKTSNSILAPEVTLLEVFS